MTRRIYRLGALLAHAGACKEWREWITQFRTADEVFAAINAEPGRFLGSTLDGDVSFAVRWFGWHLAPSGSEEEREWRCRAWPNGLGRAEVRATPITLEERARFLSLWQRYADRHGLYEEIDHG